MPDLVNYSITRLANAQITAPQFRVDGQVVDSKTQKTVIADLTANNIIFPNVLGSLTTAQQDAWVADVMRDLIYRRFGIA